ncbi:efflux RND transporter periplasmic adaptor subunit [Rhizobium sp. NLR17b]|nr:efflux RND transporter periplasmic adaptor subunit [Rhizobium sp. NLR17b]
MPEDTPIDQEYPGRISPVRIAEVRARVSGIVLSRKFVEGSTVKAGDLLFEVDPAKFEAAVESASAQLARAEAAFTLASQQADRVQTLIRTNVATKDQFDVAVATRRQAEAEVEVQRANLRTAELDLSYASVRSPIDGRIEAAQVTEGAFVRQEDATLMATVRDIHAIYVDFTASLTELDKVREQIAAGELKKPTASAEVTLVGGRGTVHSGRLLFSTALVNETTGQVSLRAEFPNEDGSLLPGTYVRVKMTSGVVAHALLVPQRAVQLDTLGQAKVVIVQDGKAVPRSITTAQSIDNRWLVTSGLKAGDEVIVDGLERVMPGAAVKAETIAEPQQKNAQAASCDEACAASNKS